MDVNNKELLRDIIQWDIPTWSHALDFWERNVDWSKVHHCLELGGRDGGLSLWLALKGKSVVCSDLEDTRTRALKHHQKHGVDQHVRYEIINALDIPYENEFDIVTIKSVLVNIGGDEGQRQQQMIDQVYKALKPGGKLLFAENLTGSSLHRLIRRRMIHWTSACRYVSCDDLRRFTSKFKRCELETTGVLGIFGRTELQRGVLSLVDRGLLNHVVPRNWQYLVYGFAEK